MYVCIGPWYWLYLAMKNKNDNLPARLTGDSGLGEVTVSGIEAVSYTHLTLPTIYSV